MKTTINCFLPFSRLEETVQTVKELRASTLVDKIYLLASPITNVCIPGCELISVEKCSLHKQCELLQNILIKHIPCSIPNTLH